MARYACTWLLGCIFWLTGTTLAGELSAYPEQQDPSVPAFTLKALDGNEHRLEDYRGKVVLVNFWASWCPPCLAELPSMQRLAERLPAKTFEVLLVNVGESAFRAAKFMQLIGIRLTTLLDPDGETFKAWGADVYPTSYILDSEGKIRYVARGPLEWDDEALVSTLRKILPEE